MTFDWSQYLNLAKELGGFASPPANQEAKMRAAISRAYYAAFMLAKNHLRDREGLSIPKTADAHRYVSEQFALSPEPVRKLVGEKLIRLRLYRNQADYVDRFPGLSVLIGTAITLSEEVIAELRNL